MKTSSEKSSASNKGHSASNQPFFAKAENAGFFAAANPAPAIQLKMEVSQPGDAFEQEADKMADKVVRTPTPPMPEKDKPQRPPDSKLEQKEKIQRKANSGTSATGTSVQSAIQNKTSGGQTLSGDVRSFMEPRFGADFSDVRVHHDAESASLNNQLNARAFTYQNHVFFSQGQYQPGSSEGKRLLAHELTHTLQQGQGSPAAQRLIQRAAPDGTDTSKLDALIARVGAECDAFGTYKKRPLDGRSMPGMGKSIQLAVSRWDGGPTQPWMKGYVREKMGPLRTKLLNEMIGMSGSGWPDYETLFDASFQNPGHKYTMNLKASKTIKEKAIEKLVPIATISYANAFGWAWHRDYTLAAVEINAGISAKNKGKKVKPGGGISPGFLSLDIKGTASAKPTPIRYSGGNDFTGPVTVLKTSAKAHLGPAGGAVPGLTAVVFHGTAFGDVSFPFISPLDGSVSGKDKDAGVDVSIGMGVGKSVGMDETTVTPPPELKEAKQLAKSFREWEAIIGPFETGKALVSPVAAKTLDQLHTTAYGFKTKELDPQAKDLRDQSVDPDKNFQLDFEVVGMASRSWAAARSNAARLKQNELLSQRRASAVETEIHNRFANVHEVHKTGAGAHVVGPSEEGSPSQMLDDAEAQKLYEKKREEAMQIKNPDERRMVLKGIEANYGPNSDQQEARRVYVFCRWEGFMIMKTLVPVPPPSPKK